MRWGLRRLGGSLGVSGKPGVGKKTTHADGKTHIFCVKRYAFVKTGSGQKRKSPEMIVVVSFFAQDQEMSAATQAVLTALAEVTKTRRFTPFLY